MAKVDFTYLKILEILPKKFSSSTMVKALCTLCENIVEVRKTRITGLEQASCGCISKLKPDKDVTGEIINDIIFIGFISSGKWKVRYKCGHEGTTKVFRALNSSTGMCNSCSKSFVPTQRIRHGMCDTPTYNSWGNMRRRCYTESNNRFEFYGEKGITVCDRWLNSFDNFLEDMGVCPEGFSLERKDLKLGYSPENCIWADVITQANNKTSNILIEDNEGTVWSLRRWCDILSKDYKSSWYKIRTLGQSVEEVLGDNFSLKQMR